MLNNRVFITFPNIAIFSVFLLFFMRIGETLVGLHGTTASIYLALLCGIGVFFKFRQKTLLLKSAKWILITILMLCFFYIIGHGDSQDTVNLIKAYLFPLSIYFIAYYSGYYNKNDAVRFLIIPLFILSFILVIPTVLTVFSGAQIDKSLVADVYSNDVKSFIIIWPLMLIISTASYAFIYFNERNASKVYLGIFLIILISLVLSTFTAVLGMMIISIYSYYFMISTKKSFLKMFLISGFALLMAIYLLQLIGNGYWGDLGGTADKVNAFIMVFQSLKDPDVDDLLNQATSTRWYRYENSINSFLSSPLYGHGYYWNKHMQIDSGHSSILDNLAYFGVMSFIILFVYVKFVVDAFKLTMRGTLHNEIKKNALFFGVLVGFILISFLNPYFIHQPLNESVFFIGGWVAGNLRYKTTSLRLHVT